VHPRPIHISSALPSLSPMASRSVQPFLHSSRQSVPILYNGPLFLPISISPSHGTSGPNLILIHDSLGPSEPTTQTASRSIQHSLPQSIHILYNGRYPDFSFSRSFVPKNENPYREHSWERKFPGMNVLHMDFSFLGTKGKGPENEESVIPMGRTFHLQSCPFPWGICPLSIIRGSLGPPSLQPKRHLAWFSRFCRAHYCDISADRQTLLGM